MIESPDNVEKINLKQKSLTINFTFLKTRFNYNYLL